MNTNVDRSNSCSCKGIRTCLKCEKHSTENIEKQAEIFTFCEVCGKAFKDLNPRQHPAHGEMHADFQGVFVIEDFISQEEEAAILSEIYKTPFVDSQSGRRKQDYGPKVNFKRQKIKCEKFSGLPEFSALLYTKMKKFDILDNFVPVEVCNLEYVPERGSSIDPHVDDSWIWGERLVTVNLCSDTILTMTRDDFPDIEVHVPMNRRSLTVVYGDARYIWKHSIYRYHITNQRLAVTFRELSNEFLSGGSKADVGSQLIETALTFRGQAVS